MVIFLRLNLNCFKYIRLFICKHISHVRVLILKIRRVNLRRKRSGLKRFKQVNHWKHLIKRFYNFGALKERWVEIFQGWMDNFFWNTYFLTMILVVFLKFAKAFNLILNWFDYCWYVLRYCFYFWSVFIYLFKELFLFVRVLTSFWKIISCYFLRSFWTKRSDYFNLVIIKATELKFLFDLK